MEGVASIGALLATIVDLAERRLTIDASCGRLRPGVRQAGHLIAKDVNNAEEIHNGKLSGRPC
jgi:hypothetical protein